MGSRLGGADDAAMRSVPDGASGTAGTSVAVGDGPAVESGDESGGESGDVAVGLVTSLGEDDVVSVGAVVESPPDEQPAMMTRARSPATNRRLTMLPRP